MGKERKRKKKEVVEERVQHIEIALGMLGVYLE